MKKQWFAGRMELILKAAAAAAVSLAMCLSPLSVAAEEAASYAIETENAKLSYVGSRMLDEAIPYGESEGKEYALIIYEYENYTMEAKQPWSDFWPRVYQNGVELDELSSRNQIDGNEDYALLDSYYKTVIKGGRLQFGQAYEIADDSPLTVILSENGASTVDPVAFEINIGDEVPAEGTVSDDAADAAADDDAAEAETETKTEAQTEAAEQPAMTAEELEAEISRQPVHVQGVVVTDSEDSRFYDYDLTYRNCQYILPQIVNNSEDDIKDIQVWTCGWDENNLPVTLSYSNTKCDDIIHSEVGLVPGAVSNLDDAETINPIPVDYNCRMAKAKCLVAGYRTYSGDTWSNPLAADWVKCYKNQKLVEPVVYTDEATVMKVQEALNAAGFDCGTPDGKAGPKTFAALNEYQNQNGLIITNDITDSLLVSLGLAEEPSSEAAEETAGEDAGGNAGSEEDVKALLQGAWMKDGTETTLTFDGSSYQLSGAGTEMNGEYYIDTEQQEVVLVFETTDGTVGAHFYYSLEGDALSLKDKSGTFSKVS